MSVSVACRKTASGLATCADYLPPDIALLKQQYNERRRRGSDGQEKVLAPVTAPESIVEKGRATRPRDLDVGPKNTRPRSIQAEAGRLTLHPVAAPHAEVHHPRGIFLRGVASHPVPVPQFPTVPDADTRGGCNGFDELRFLGVNYEPGLHRLHLHSHQQHGSAVGASDKPPSRLSMRATPPSDVQLPPLHTLSAEAPSSPYRETADLTYPVRGGYTTPPLDGGSYAGHPSYEGSGRAETIPSALTVTPEKSNIWASSYPTAARQPRAPQPERQHQYHQQVSTHTYPPCYQRAVYGAYDYCPSYLTPQWVAPAYAEPPPPRDNTADNRAVSADPRRYEDNLHRSWNRPVSAPPPQARETTHLLNAMRGEPAAARPCPTQWPSAPLIQGSHPSTPRDTRQPWTPAGIGASQPVVGVSEWPEPITVPGSTPTWDPSPTSSHFQVPYTPQPYPHCLYPVPTATNGMPPMIEKQIPPDDMYYTSPTPIY